MHDLTVQKQTSNNILVIPEQGLYLTFFVGKERLGIGVHEVKEIIEIDNITRVPMTPSFIRGVINLRGNVVPVVDLSARLNRERSDLTKRSCIVLVEIITEDESQYIGMLVDQVDEILEIPNKNIQPAPEFGANIRVEFIQSMGRVDEKFIILLEVSRVLSVTELSQLSHSINADSASIPETDSQ
jgi:purine-binding chemotaxis protein CheW